MAFVKRIFSALDVSPSHLLRFVPCMLPIVSTQVRTVVQIPHWENHIRFDPHVGRKRPCRDVIDRFKRLNSGMWIRGWAGKHSQRWRKTKRELEQSYQHMMVNPFENQILDKMMTPYWLRPHYFIDDPYKYYHVRHGLNEPRCNQRGRLLRERPKILLEDTIADQHFYDR